MHGSTALLLLTLAGDPARAPLPAPPALSLDGARASQTPWVSRLSLRAGRLLAQPAAAVAATAAQPVAPSPARTGVGAADAAPAEACDVDCETAREGQRLGRYVMRNRERTLRTHRVFAIAAWSAMLVTEVLGTVQAINQDTWFGRGNCASNPRAFACEQYSLVQSLHEGFAFVTTGLYTTAGVLAVAAPDPESAAEGSGGAERRLRAHKVLAYIHGAGMILLPVLGILSIHPEILGIDDNATRADFTRAVRSVHTLVGYGTFAALTAAGVLEF